MPSTLNRITATEELKTTGPNRKLMSEEYERTRRATTSFCEPLAIEDYVIQAMADVSPAKWHLGHTTWFFERFILNEHINNYDPYHPKYGYLFNSYYNAVGPMHCRPNRGLLSRPTVEQIDEYRREIDRRMLELLAQADDQTLGTIEGQLFQYFGGRIDEGQPNPVSPQASF